MPGKTRRKLVTSKSDDNEIFREGLMFASHRLKTFKRWRFNKKGVCTAEALANAGFVHTGKDSAKCVYCGKEMLWDCDDDPFIEHKSHSPKCIFVIMNQPSTIHALFHFESKIMYPIRTFWLSVLHAKRFFPFPFQ